MSPEPAGASATATTDEALSAVDKAAVLETLWGHFACTARQILERRTLEAERGLSEMVAAFDLLFRTQAGDRVPDGRIRDVIMFQLHGILTERLHAFLVSKESSTEATVVNWLVGAITVCQELANLAAAFENVTADSTDTGAGQFSFAGNSSFIPIEQVVQLLGGSRYRGLLTLEDNETQLDLYFDNSAIAFMSPHRLLRRVLTGTNMRGFREIPADLLTRAERRLAESEKPIVISLQEEKFLKPQEVKDIGHMLGSEVFYVLLRSGDEVRFRYRPLDELPGFVSEHRINMRVTPLLLEANKQRDDWQRLLRIFPNPDRPVEPTEDALKQIGNMDLAAHELRILTAIDNGKTTPRMLGDIAGLPLNDVYRTLIRFARDDVVKPQCDADVFAEMILQGIAEDDDAPRRRPAPPREDAGVNRSVSDALDFLNG